ncbi:phage tail length tape measure family protein [Massilia timonae]|uniref:phage tail length tape measure family protein n=2 Tax=Massilia timonae TaxID=47229 RepID=UPI002355D18D|nr:phage tail length tape measure family protein [Massilia timonae]
MATEERRIQFVTEVDNTGARAGFDDLSQQAGQMANSVAASGQRAERAVNDIGNGAGASSAKVEAAQRNLIGSIQRTTAQMEAGSRSSSKYFETLAQQRGVDPQVLEPYLAQLRAVELAQQRARTAALGGASGIDDLGVSAGQTRAALQQLPAQITDVVTSLQGGQAPLTVLIQQGGQIADAFGGIQPALQGVGQHLLKLINPYTALAAVAATLAVAYYQGSKEADAYSRALVMSGNAAGASRDQLADMAREIGKVVGTQAQASEAVAALAGTGEVSARNLREFGELALRMQKDVGQSVQDTVKDFAELGKSPVEASQRLNEAYRYLTAATMDQIRALDEQGRTEEAAEVAQKAYATAFGDRTAKLRDDLGIVEGAWRSVTGAAKSAWDAFLDVGRTQTPQQRLDEVNAALSSMSKRGIVGGGAASAMAGRRRSALEAEKVELEFVINKDEWDSAQAAISQRLEKDMDAWNAAGDQYLSKANKLAAQEERIRKAGESAGVAEEEIVKRIAAARKAALQGDWDAAAKKREDALRAEAAALSEIAGLTTTFAADWKMLSDLYAKGSLSLEQLTKAQADLLANQPGIKAAAEQEIADRKVMAAAAEEYAKAYDIASGARTKAAGDLEGQLRENEQIGLGAVALAELNAVRLEGMALRAEEKVWMAEGLDITGQMAERYREEAVALRERAQAVREGAAKEAAFESSKRALDELNRFLDPARAQTFGDALREAFGTAGDSISRLTASLDSFGRKQAENEKNRGNAALLYLEGRKSEVEYLADVEALSKRSTQNQLAGYGAMTGAAAGFFNEQSRGYKALQTASQVFHAAELAMTLAELVPKGISAVLGQGQGDPYTAFGRMAAMAAIVAGLGVAIGGVSGGGVPLSQQRQEKQGTGTVLGSDAKSESIARSLEAIEGATLQGLGISNGMLTSLRNIEAGIGQFASLLVRTTGVTGDFGSDLNKQAFDSKAIGLGGAAGGALLGAVGGAYVGMGTSYIGAMLGGPVGMALGAALGAIIGKTFIGKALGSVFGGKQTVEDTGLTIGAMDFASIFGGGLNAMQYADIKKDGGWFRSDTYSTKTEGLGEEGNRQIASVLMSLYDTVLQAGSMLDIGADGFAAQLNSFVVDIGKVSLKGLSDDEIQKELEAVFSKVGDDLAKFGVGGLEQFQKVGEGYLETLTRVATNYQAVAVVTDSLGMTFGSLGLASVGARERLIDLVGGLDEFTSSADQFLSDFYTDRERADSLRARIAPTLDQFGIKTGAEDSLQQFRSVVTGLDLTTEAGARAYATLIQIAPAFKQIADVDAKIFEERADLQKELDQLTLSETQLLAQQRAALDESNRALFDQIQAVKAKTAADEAATAAIEKAKSDATALMGGVDSAFSVLQRVVDRQKKALQEEISVRTASIQKIEALSQSLRSTLDGMTVSGREAEDRRAAQAQIEAALAIAKASGKLPSAEDLRSALSVVSRDSSALFASQEDYLRDFYATRIGIEDLAGLTDNALSVEERSLKQLEDQVKQYDLMLEREQEQIDVLKGLSITGLSIEQAIQALHGAMQAASANPVNSVTSAISDAYKSALGRAPDQAGFDYWKDRAAGGISTGAIVDSIKNSPEAQIQALYKDVFGRPADAAGLNYWIDRLQGGISLGAIRDTFESSDEAKKKLRGFAVGTNYIPVDMPAMVHQGERIIPAADNRELMRRLASPEQGNEVLVAEIRALREEVALLRRTNSDENYSIAKHAMDTASHLDDAINGLKPVAVKVIEEEATQ